MLIVETPTTLIPPAKTSTPVLAVTMPRESTFLTSSYVIVPPTVTLPLKKPSAAVMEPAMLMLLGTSLVLPAPVSYTHLTLPTICSV